MAHDEQRWLSPRLQKAAALCNQAPAASESPLWLGIDLGTCDVVSMVVDRDGQPVAVCLDWADAVRTAVINKRAGGMGLILGRKAFKKSMADGVKLINAVQDVYLDGKVTIA